MTTVRLPTSSRRQNAPKGLDEPVPEYKQITAPDELWAEYKRTGAWDLRNKLILRYSPLVKYIAGRVSAGLPGTVELSDLVSYGIFGLIDAIEKFDDKRPVRFETYAITRIKGAIIDELRRTDWVPRSVRAKAKAIETAYAGLEAQLQRPPSDVEVAAELGLSEQELQAQFSQISFLGVVPLDEVLAVTSEGGGERGRPTTLGDTIADPHDGPMAVYEVEEMKRVLAGVINQLPDREKIVLVLTYYEGLTLAEIGRVLGVTESRACQIHTKAVLQLRAKMFLAEKDTV